MLCFLYIIHNPLKNIFFELNCQFKYNTPHTESLQPVFFHLGLTAIIIVLFLILILKAKNPFSFPCSLIVKCFSSIVILPANLSQINSKQDLSLSYFFIQLSHFGLQLIL